LAVWRLRLPLRPSLYLSQLLVAALAIFSGPWLYGAYAYPYAHPYTFHNSSAAKNQTLPVECLCQQYSVCGCDENNNSTYMDSLIGNGSEAALNRSLVRVTRVNGTQTIVINGTLPNGTTASGGTESASAGVRQMVMENAGWWVIGAAVSWMVWSV